MASGRGPRKKLTLSVVMGTRPEVIKLAPLVLEARRRGHGAKVVLTGQHAHLALPLLEFFGLTPDVNLNIMRPNQSLTGLSSLLLESLDSMKQSILANCLISQGDTTSAFIASYWAFCHNIPVAHVEAGLRTNQLKNPFPEEANRQLISRIADFHFAPTAAAKSALIAERIPASRVHKVGNTAIDSLVFTLEAIENGGAPASMELDLELIRSFGDRRIVLVTSHRRESFGKPFADICRGILGLLEQVPDIVVVYPVHPNPNIRVEAEKLLGGNPRVRLIEPLSYVAFVSLMRLSSLILTDSGGVQEEAPTIKKPILVMRETSERPEGIKLGFAKLVGTDPVKIIRESKLALKKGCLGRGKNPYGDGRASARIMSVLEKGL